MATSTIGPEPAPDEAVAVELALGPQRWWWLWLLIGFAWLVAALVILQFDAASVNTVGGSSWRMFLAAGTQQLVIASMTESTCAGSGSPSACCSLICRHRSASSAR